MNDRTLNKGRKCSAKKASTGEPCGMPPIRGGTVCMAHGGRAPQVRQRADKRYAETLADLIDPNRALREAACLAYSDITKLYGEDGRILPMTEWPIELRAAVSVNKTETVRGNLDKGDGQFDQVLKQEVRLWDKPRNLELLFKHLGLLKEMLEHSGRIEIGWKGE